MHSAEQGPVLAALDDPADDRCRAVRAKEVGKSASEQKRLRQPQSKSKYTSLEEDQRKKKRVY